MTLLRYKIFRMKRIAIFFIFILSVLFSSLAGAETLVKAPHGSGGELNLYQVINAMMGTSFTGPMDPNLTALEIENDGEWREYDGYISISATYAGYWQKLYWENSQNYYDLILVADADGFNYNSYYFQTNPSGEPFYFKDVTNVDTWYSLDSKNYDLKTHMITYAFPNDIYICGFEDLYNLGDQDYQDLVFMISHGAAPTCIPAVKDIPNQTISARGSFNDIQLDYYVQDGDHNDSEINWDAPDGINISVDIDPDTRIATITYHPVSWVGSETITFTATDPDGHSDSDDVTFKVNPPEAPVVRDIPDQVTRSGIPFQEIKLDDYVIPPPNFDYSDIQWTKSGGDKISVSINSNTRTATISYPPSWIGSEKITFIATVNPSDSDEATFTVVMPRGVVGGTVIPVNKAALLIPWIVICMLITSVIAAIAIWHKKKRSG
jgi:hypothetical protein